MMFSCTLVTILDTDTEILILKCEVLQGDKVTVKVKGIIILSAIILLIVHNYLHIMHITLPRL